MSKNALVAILAGAVVVVAILAVLTPTVILRGGGEQRAGIRIAHMDLPGGGWAPYPGGAGPLPPPRLCLEQRGLDRSNRTTPRGLDKMWRGLRDCPPAFHR